MIDLPPVAELWLPPRPAIIRSAGRGLVKASILPGMFPAGMIAAAAAPPAASISYVTAVTNTIDGTSFTFTSASVGAAAAGRKVIVGCLIRSVATNLTATYAGNAMSQLAFVDGNNASLAIFAIDEASLTSATIVITGSGSTMTAARIWIWNGFNCAATARATGSDIVGATVPPNNVWTSGSMNCPAGSVVAGVTAYADVLASTGATAWTMLTERNDGLVEGNATTASAADATLAAANPALVITATSAIGAGPIGGGLLAVCL